MLHYEDYTKTADSFGIPVTRKSDTDVSFTPYISNGCSANCRFCSENLCRDGQKTLAGQIREADREFYLERLSLALDYIKDRKIFLSVSGKEPSVSVEHLEILKDGINSFISKGGNIRKKVMYSNLSGFVKESERLLAFCRDIDISHIECSRHHFDEDVNQSIVGFFDGEEIRKNDVFKSIVSRLLSEGIAVKLVCVIQKSGIKDLDDIVRYIKFANSAGVYDVVFRELAMFEDSIDDNAVSDYIVRNRVELKSILDEIQNDGTQSFHLEEIVEGYYYYSFKFSYGKTLVRFEMSDYEEMIRHHKSDELKKLILYPDGNVCKDWNMFEKLF